MSWAESDHIIDAKLAEQDDNLSTEQAHGRGYDEGHRDGKYAAAQELMAIMRNSNMRDTDWNGGDLVELVDTWLQEKGVDTHVYADEYDDGTDAHAFGSQAELDEHIRTAHDGDAEQVFEFEGEL